MSPPASDTVRVLLVEDAFDQALLVKSFFQSGGDFEVTHSQDGDQAARLLREREWDLLVTDLNLPGLDGFELTRIARSIDPPIPVLATTGYTGAHYAESAFRAGANELLVKPLDKDDFLAKVRDLTGTVAEVERNVVLAIGGLVGDVEMGCGGTLVKMAAAEDDVAILPLCRDETDDPSAGLVAARSAAELLGVRLIAHEDAMNDTDGRVEILETVVRDLKPNTVLMPAMDDGHAARREAFRIGKVATAPVPRVLTYQTATTGFDFRPQHFEDIRDQLMRKMEALTAYQEAGASRLDLMPRLAQAYARYWGRFEGFSEVEAFEIIRGS